jgi:hypothetical protein
MSRSQSYQSMMVVVYIKVNKKTFALPFIAFSSGGYNIIIITCTTDHISSAILLLLILTSLP